jgi:hypothetical protein
LVILSNFKSHEPQYEPGYSVKRIKNYGLIGILSLSQKFKKKNKTKQKTKQNKTHTHTSQALVRNYCMYTLFYG